MPTELARRTIVDVSVDNTNWTTFIGKTDVNPTITPTKQDATTYENGGWKSSEVTLQEWSLVVKCYRESNSSNVLDPTQQLLIARIGQFGTAARIYTRWYDNQGRADQAWSGYAIVEFANTGTAVDGLDEDTFTFTGDGILTPITNPYASSLAPVVLAATPGSATTGGLVKITGQGFATATTVKFGAVTATVTQILGDTTILAVVPSGSAGSAPVTVINPVGTSNALAYTRT